MIEFNQIIFGLSAGEDEASRYPELIRDGFFDKDNVINELVNGHKHLVLGYKGSGKSLIGEKLLALAKDSHDIFCIKYFLADFPFKQFSKIIPGVSDLNSNYPLSWSWLLLLLLLNQALNDQKAISKLESSEIEFIDQLKTIGLLPAKDLRSLVTKSSKTSFKAGCQFLGFEHENSADFTNHFSYLVDLLKGILCNLSPVSKHLLILDGLDDILLMRDIQYQSIAALIFEVNRLNQFFQRGNYRYKIVILCRTDLFERLPAPNKNKQRRDSAIDIDWYHDTRDPRNSKLVELANMRASLSDSKCTDIFEQYMPKLNEHGKEIIPFLLDHTRHTPRDFIELLNSIKKFATSGKLSRNAILSGLTDYSKNYFLPEIKDEMVGYVHTELFETFMQILGSFRDREISITTLFEKCSDKIETKEVERILYALFECSAIGNKFHGVNGGENRYFFRFRNRNYTYSLGDTVVIHHGLWKAIGII